MRSLIEFASDMLRAVPIPRFRRPVGQLVLTRCPAAERTDGGWLRCLERLPCSTPGHDRWPLVPMAVVWSVAPWWPNRLGRLQDRGLAHTPNIWPCKHCERERAAHGT